MKLIVLCTALLAAVSVMPQDATEVNHTECLGIWQFEYQLGKHTVGETWVLRSNSKYIRFFTGLPRRRTALDEETGTFAVIDNNRILFIFDSDVGGRMFFHVRKEKGKYTVSRDKKQWYAATRPLVGSLDE